MLNYPITTAPGPLLALPEPNPDTLAATAVAFANTDGGTMMFADVDSARLADALRQAGDRCNPPVAFGAPEQVETPGGPVMAVRVPRSARVHALLDGRVMVRAANGNRELDGREIRQLLANKSNGDFETDTVPGATLADLDPDRVRDFANRWAAHTGASPPTDSADLLAGIGAITSGEGVTVAGLLLFGAEPERWLPQSAARFVRFVGQAGHHPQRAFEETVSGPLPRLIDGVWDLIHAQVPAAVITGEPDAAIYPPDAVREVLINAVTHRDYRLRKCIEVRLYADRLDITSPGGLPGFMTVEHLRNGRFSRNPRLAWGLWAWGYVPEPGLGIDRLYEVMVQHGRRPHFVAQPYSVTARLYGARTSDHAGSSGPDADSTPISQRQRAALDHVQAHGSITLHEFCALYAKVRPELLQQDLADLVARGRLRRIGGRVRAYYIAE